MGELQERVGSLEEQLRQSHVAKELLTNEKTALIETVKGLSKDVHKLQNLKQTLLRSLDDSMMEGLTLSNTSPDSMPPVEADELVARALRSAQGRSVSSFPQDPTPQLQPASTPRVRPVTFSMSAAGRVNGSAEGLSTTSAPPLQTPAVNASVSGPVAPHVSLTSSGALRSSTTSSTSSLPGSSPYTPRVDGKEFFQQARAKLSYEQFSEFLKEIKRLNAGEQSREATLEAASRIFGEGNGELYTAFDALLSRHTTRPPPN